MLTFLKYAWICGYGDPARQDYAWKKKKVLRKETWRERDAQTVFESACFRLTKKARFRVMMFKGKGGRMAILWFVAKVVVLLKFKSGKRVSRAK